MTHSFTGAPGALPWAISAALAYQHPDAELIRLCSEYEATEREID